MPQRGQDQALYEAAKKKRHAQAQRKYVQKQRLRAQRQGVNAAIGLLEPRRGRDRDASAAAAADRSLTSCRVDAASREGSVGFVFVEALSSAAYLISRARRSSVLRAVSFEVKSGRARSKGAGLAT